MKLVYGVGINDADYIIQKKVELPRVDGKRKQLVVWTCPFYVKWKGMLERAYCPKFASRHTSYEFCTVDTKWHKFSTFKAWMIEQPWEKMCLDKDVLVVGNKIYGEDYCAFLPHRVNSLLLDAGAKSGVRTLPIGVSYQRPSKDMVNELSKPYRATISNKVKDKYPKHLGVFPTITDAHKVWQRAKADHIDSVVDWWKFDSEVNHSFRDDIAEALWTRANKLRYQAENSIETFYL